MLYFRRKDYHKAVLWVNFHKDLLHMIRRYRVRFSESFTALFRCSKSSPPLHLISQESKNKI